MDYTKSVPEYDVGVVETSLWISGDPSWDALGWLARCLRYVTACWMDLLVIVWESRVSNGLKLR